MLFRSLPPLSLHKSTTPHSTALVSLPPNVSLPSASELFVQDAVHACNSEWRHKSGLLFAPVVDMNFSGDVAQRNIAYRIRHVGQVHSVLAEKVGDDDAIAMMHKYLKGATLGDKLYKLKTTMTAAQVAQHILEMCV